jgi:hypothetical protein
MTLEYATTVFLVFVFIAAEVYRSVRGQRGVILSVEEGALAQILLPEVRVGVRLNDGRDVSATLNGCTLCLGRLKIGDQVRVSPSRDGYVVDLPWFRSGKSDESRDKCHCSH